MALAYPGPEGCAADVCPYPGWYGGHLSRWGLGARGKLGLVWLALAVFALTLILVIWQPRGLGIGTSALLGAALALGLGVVHPGDIPEVWGIVWDATFAFVFVILISLILDEAGFFRWAALHIARMGRGIGVQLFILVIWLGAAIAALFANDGAALILTPIVMEMLLALGFSPAASLAFVMATGFIADAASLPLVISNLVNIVSASFFRIDFLRYAKVMVPVDLVSILASTGVLWLLYRRVLPGRYDPLAVAEPKSAIRDPQTFRLGFFVLVFLLAGYFASGPLHLPVSFVAGAGALILMASAARRVGEGPALPVGRIVREAPWQVVLFSLGMYLVVYGLRNQGLTLLLAKILEVFDRGTMVASLASAVLSAVLSAVMNNMPTVMVMALAIRDAGLDEMARQAMIYGNVIGADLGPKLTPIGSLATLLWLHVLARKGMRVGWGLYLRTGLMLTLPVLFASALALGVWLALVGA